MKIIIKILVFILCISCSNKKNENQINEFDKIIGEENIQTLDFLVSDFENDFLKRQYPNLNITESYRSFLTELRDDKTENWQKISKVSREKFKHSKLRFEIYDYPDSVWVVPNSKFDKIEEDSLAFIESPLPYIKIRKRDETGRYKFVYSRIHIHFDSTNVDSIIEKIKNTGEVKFQGKYFNAINSLKEKNKFWNEIFEYYISPNKDNLKKFSKLILDNNFDLNDITVRRIIVLECAY